MNGKWFLEYTDYDEMESMGNEVHQTEVSLVATNEVAAIEEAKLIWKEKLQEATSYWEKQKKTWALPPTGPFHGLTPNPRVVYRVSL
jgi:hypothetical protein